MKSEFNSSPLAAMHVFTTTTILSSKILSIYTQIHKNALKENLVREYSGYREVVKMTGVLFCYRTISKFLSTCKY